MSELWNNYTYPIVAYRLWTGKAIPMSSTVESGVGLTFKLTANWRPKLFASFHSSLNRRMCASILTITFVWDIPCCQQCWFLGFQIPYLNRCLLTFKCRWDISWIVAIIKTIAHDVIYLVALVNYADFHPTSLNDCPFTYFGSKATNCVC